MRRLIVAPLVVTALLLSGCPDGVAPPPFDQGVTVDLLDAGVPDLTPFFDIDAGQPDQMAGG